MTIPTNKGNNMQTYNNDLSLSCITALENVYDHAWKTHPDSYGAKLVEAIRDYKYPNGQPLNILKAVYIYKAVESMKEYDMSDDEDLRCLLNRLVRKTGYTRDEILERVTI